jgi:DNA-binding MarR family transcriptional regulator
MQVGRTSSYAIAVLRLSGKEAQLLAEIGLDWGSTATSFVDYICSRYEISKSGAWYVLKKLKEKGVVEFTEKGEGQKPLSMTEKGLEAFRAYVYEARKGVGAGGRNNPLSGFGFRPSF